MLVEMCIAKQKDYNMRFKSLYLSEMADYDAFHGTTRDFKVFSYDYTETGNDEVGAGFYFTNDPKDAEGYATGDGGNIMPTIITINKPITIDGNGKTKQKALSPIAVRKLLEMAPNIEEYLGDNWGDIDHEGYAKVFNMAHKAFSQPKDLLYQVLQIQGDLYSKHIKEFAIAMKKVTGYDGIIKTWDNGVTTHYIVWDNTQIRSKYQ